MKLICDTGVAASYSSPSQKARLISELWVSQNAYCLDCNSPSIAQTRANTAAADFICKSCGHVYELKTFVKRPARSLVDGAYKRLISQIEQNAAPTLMLLERDEQWRVKELSAIHSVFLTRQVVEARPALNVTARRAGWMGCNIRLDRLPVEAEVFVVKDAEIALKNDVRQAFQMFSPMRNLGSGERSWISLTLLTLRKLERPDFALRDVYELEQTFADAYPENRNVRAKIRQQLQRLRDLGALKFEGSGRYRLLT